MPSLPKEGIDEIREDNPALAKAIEIGTGVATGGPLKRVLTN